LPVPAIVLLPGMDGTGELLVDFAAALGTEFDVIVVSYPSDRALDYSALEHIARSRLPSNGFYVLLAESFSGPIAISIAASRPAGLAGLVLCCTFARCPRPALKALRPLIPLLRTAWLPAFAVRRLLLGRWSSVALQHSISAALKKVSIAALRARLRDVLDVDILTKVRQIQVPVLCIRATADRLVPASAASLIVRSAPPARVVELEGPHCLLQVAASSGARLVLKFVRDVGLTSRHASNASPTGAGPSHGSGNTVAAAE
jgi:pimeloyl-[acyl-carrier protein] methyl ester esterase